MSSIAITLTDLFRRRAKSPSRTKAKVNDAPLFKDRAEFDAALNQSLTELEQGKVYQVDVQNPEQSIRKLLRQAK